MNYQYNYDYTVPPDVATGAAGAGAAILGGLMLIWLLMVLVIYIYFAVCLMMIAKKTNTANSWFAWVPILNVILMLQVAKKPLWWIILIFIPLVNIIISIIVWMEIAKARGKPEWVGVLMIVPIVGFFIPAYLAFSN